MGITFQAKVDSTHLSEAKSFLAESYPHLTEDDFREWSGVFFDEETQRHYEIDHCIAFPYQFSLANTNFYEIFRMIDESLYEKTRKNDGCGSMHGTETVHFYQKVVDLLNTVHDKDPRVAILMNHIRYFGVGLEYITGSLRMFRDVAHSAIVNELEIQWG